jgi:hypothetical protein
VVTGEDEAEHRIAVRDVGDGGFEVGELIVVEDRTGDLPYLLGWVSDRRTGSSMRPRRSPADAAVPAHDRGRFPRA